jgi:hypothetical protein
MTLTRTLCSGLFALALVVGAASSAHAQNIPAAPSEQPLPALYITGSITTFASWLLAAGFGSFRAEADQDLDALGLLLVPVVGPFLQLAREDHLADQIFVGALGVLELVGLTLCVVSNFVTRPVRPRHVAFDGRSLALRF